MYSAKWVKGHSRMTHPSQIKIGTQINNKFTNRAQIRYKSHQITKLVSERHKLRLKIEI